MFCNRVMFCIALGQTSLGIWEYQFVHVIHVEDVAPSVVDEHHQFIVATRLPLCAFLHLQIRFRMIPNENQQPSPSITCIHHATIIIPMANSP
jgi:hypothetical protein